MLLISILYKIYAIHIRLLFKASLKSLAGRYNVQREIFYVRAFVMYHNEINFVIILGKALKLFDYTW